MVTPLIFGSATGKHVPHKKIFRALLKPAKQKVSEETEQIANTKNPEDELKQVLDDSFESKKKNLKKKLEATQLRDGEDLDPLIASTSSSASSKPVVTEAPSAVLNKKKVTQRKRKQKDDPNPVKGKKQKTTKKKKESIFDNY